MADKAEEDGDGREEQRRDELAEAVVVQAQWRPDVRVREYRA